MHNLIIHPGITEHKLFNLLESSITNSALTECWKLPTRCKVASSKNYNWLNDVLSLSLNLILLGNLSLEKTKSHQV